jgi:hypothetical protein
MAAGGDGMKARGVVRLRGYDREAVYEGEFVLADGGVWLGRKGLEGIDLGALLGAGAGTGAWLFLPLHMVVYITTDDNPAE